MVAKYKGPEIGNIEAHNERTKEKYASNPDVDLRRSKQNFHGADRKSGINFKFTRCVGRCCLL